MIPILAKVDNNQNLDEIVKQLMNEHKIRSVNLIKIYPEKTEITLNQVRQLQQRLIIKNKEPFGYFFYSFDSSSLEVQNSLLKTIEEKSENNLFCFFVFNLEKVVSTIRSRCQIIDYSKTIKNNFISQEIIELIESIKKADKPTFLFNEKIVNLDKERFLNFSLEMINYFRKELIKNELDQSEKIIEIIKEILKLRELVENNNLNPQLTFDNLLIFIWKKIK